ncbi:MAG: radical SAM protein [Candidatus Omnitrophica bacterium]|nr:radical SAM protein [Candidatus Omnitrophota bacterium]
MGRIKVSFVFPRFKYFSGDPPLGLGYLASYLKRELPGIDISIIDTTFTHSFTAAFRRLEEINPDIIGIYSDAIMSRDALSIADWSRERKIFTVFGGPQPTVSPDIFIARADAVVRGEGEATLAELLKRHGDKDLSSIPGLWWKKDGEVVRNRPNRDFLDLDSLPFPQRDLLAMRSYMYYWNYLDAADIHRRGTTMMVSRSCPFVCSYCQPVIHEMFGEKLRLRSPENIIQEVASLQEQYGVDSIFFHDDTFTVDHHWLAEFCKRLDNLRPRILWGCNSRVDTVDEEVLKLMHVSGLRNIHFGIESASQRILDAVYNKQIRIDKVRDVIASADRIGIDTMGFFMLGAPGETPEEINKTISFAMGLKLKEASFSLTTPLSGTYLYRKLLLDDSFEIDKDYDNRNYYSRYSIKGGIGFRRIKRLQLKAFLLFYLHPFRLKYILKHLLHPRGIRKLFIKTRRSF